MTDKQIDNRVKRLQALNEEIKALEAKSQALRDELTKEIESRGTEELKTDSFLVRWTTTIRNTLDSKKLKADLPSIYENYLRTTESRRFSIA